jgi:hypothetical protein
MRLNELFGSIQAGMVAPEGKRLILLGIRERDAEVKRG